MKKRAVYLSILLLSFTTLLVNTVSAHCPLCTIGAGAGAGLAAYLGVNKIVIGLFIGAFAMSMGMWFARWADKKKKIIPFQKTIIVILVFVTTVYPLMPIFSAVGPLYLSFIGEYGITYAFNYSILSSLFGGVLVFLSPQISRKVTKLRQGRTIPFQGVSITLLSLIIVGLLIQFLV